MDNNKEKKSFGVKVKEAAGKVAGGVKKVVKATWKFAVGGAIGFGVKAFLDSRDSLDNELLETEEVTTED